LETVGMDEFSHSKYRAPCVPPDGRGARDKQKGPEPTACAEGSGPCFDGRLTAMRSGLGFRSRKDPGLVSTVKKRERGCARRGPSNKSNHAKLHLPEL
jgi:hypothetical protein